MNVVPLQACRRLLLSLSAVARELKKRSAQRGTVGLRFGSWRGGEEDTWGAPTGAALSRACLMLPEWGTLSASCTFYAEFSTITNHATAGIVTLEKKIVLLYYTYIHITNIFTIMLHI